jgi:hypothetical protein
MCNLSCFQEFKRIKRPQIVISLFRAKDREMCLAKLILPHACYSATIINYRENNGDVASIVRVCKMFFLNIFRFVVNRLLLGCCTFYRSSFIRDRLFRWYYSETRTRVDFWKIILFRHHWKLCSRRDIFVQSFRLVAWRPMFFVVETRVTVQSYLRRYVAKFKE